MTDKKDKDKDVVVNLFKNGEPQFFDQTAALRIPSKEYQRMVLEGVKRIEDDVPKLKATGMITILMDDKGPLIDYFVGSVNLTQAYVLMDQIKNVIIDKLNGAEEEE
tara:strand:+ start:1758 stop:2078 length:321 start_codon:yes stop_codon:yes gene_type:complete